MKRIFLVILSTISILGGGVLSAEAKPPLFVLQKNFSGQEYAPGEVIVKFKEGVAESVLEKVRNRLGAKKLFQNSRLKFQKLRIPREKTVQQMLASFRADPSVEYAEPNYVFHAHVFPNDPLYTYQWHLDNPVSGGIHMEQAWGLSQGDEVVVAVIDTGVAYEDYDDRVSSFRTDYFYQAPDFAQTDFVAGYDFVNDDDHPNDDHGHGTHVAGTIAQSTDNSEGVAGVAFRAKIMPVKVISSRGSGYSSDVAAGIIWATDNGADVINMSFGNSLNSTTVRNACTYAVDHGVTLVCSSGNDGRNRLSYPAAYDTCISVGATRFDETRTYYSNYGEGLDLVAPGGDLEEDQNYDGAPDGVLQQTFSGSTDNFGYYLSEGTSMAAPHVSGVAALVIAAGVATGPDEVREALQSTAKDLGDQGYDDEHGWGLVDAFAALNYGDGGSGGGGGGGEEPPQNNPPIADAGGPYNDNEDQPILFDGSGSGDPDQDALTTYTWDFGDGVIASTGNALISHTYSLGGVVYPVSLVVSDGQVNSEPAFADATIAEINDAPFADPGGDYYGEAGVPLALSGSGSTDEEDDDIFSFDWDFGDGNFGSGENPTHTYEASGDYSVELTVTDSEGLTHTNSTTAHISEAVDHNVLFEDSFEAGEWNGLWAEDRQNDWITSSQRATDGSYSAEVDGMARDAELVSIPINLHGNDSVTVSFSWYMEKWVDRNEYVAFEVSSDGGASWIEKARIKGDVDVEEVWHEVTVPLSGINSLRLRFLAYLGISNEDVNVDNVRVEVSN